MIKKVFGKKVVFFTAFCLMLAVSYSNAFARDEGRGGGHREVVVVGRERYHYHDGRFFKPGWFGWFEFNLVTPPIGAVISVLPYGYQTIVVGGLPYYYYDNIYYRPCPSGYIVVPQPVLNTIVVSNPVVTQPSGETVTINVPNSHGGYTSVILVKYNNGYLGPQGEYYSGNPTVEQLKILYGK